MSTLERKGDWMPFGSAVEAEQKRQVVRDLLASLPPEEWPQGLSPEELERLRQVLQVQPKGENSSHPE
jgi:hypothetical protein